MEKKKQSFKEKTTRALDQGHFEKGVVVSV